MEVKMKLEVKNEMDLYSTRRAQLEILPLLVVVVVVRFTRRFGDELQTRCHGVPLPA